MKNSVKYGFWNIAGILVIVDPLFSPRAHLTPQGLLLIVISSVPYGEGELTTETRRKLCEFVVNVFCG